MQFQWMPRDRKSNSSDSARSRSRCVGSLSSTGGVRSRDESFSSHACHRNDCHPPDAESPELLGAGSAKTVERSDPRSSSSSSPLAPTADRSPPAKRTHLARAARECAPVSARLALSPAPLAPGSCVAHSKARPRVIDAGGLKWNPQTVAFEDVNQRPVETFAVGQHTRHKLRRVVVLQPCGLYGLHAYAVL